MQNYVYAKRVHLVDRTGTSRLRIVKFNGRTGPLTCDLPQRLSGAAGRLTMAAGVQNLPAPLTRDSSLEAWCGVSCHLVL